MVVGKTDGEKENGVKSHEIHVECPDRCMDKVSYCMHYERINSTGRELSIAISELQKAGSP